LARLATIGLALALTYRRPSAGIARKIRGLQTGLLRLRESRPSLPRLAATFAYMTAICFFQAAGFVCVLHAASDATPTFLTATWINAVGWLVGFFAFFAPTGIGVREGSVGALLAVVVPLDAAVVGVIIWRVVQILVELAWLAACFLPAGFGFVRRLAPGMGEKA
jgi:uncharacterized membrane protein YbhN (UPF0104 family)